MSKTYEETVKELDSNIPRDVISERSAGAGRSLSYLEGWYVIDRLNKVLGIGKWGYLSDVSLLHHGQVDGKYSTHYMAKVTLTATIADGHNNLAIFTDYGYGDGMDRGNPGKSHELAIKEAVTDGIKRCAKNLGMSMGLALYDKDKEYVGERSDPVQKTSPKPPVAPTPKAVASTKTREAVLKQISQLVEISKAKRVASIDDLRSKLKSNYNVDKADQLTDEQALSFVRELETLVS